MSFKVRLELDGKTYNILACRYNFSQNVDSTGLPKGMPRGREIFIRLESIGEPDLFKWMNSVSKTKDGKIIYYRRDATSKLQEPTFKKAFCISFTEDFNVNSTEPLQMEFVMSAQQISINGVTHNRQWKMDI